MKVGHQLMAITGIAGWVYLAHNLNWSTDSLHSIANICIYIPIIWKYCASYFYNFLVATITALLTIPIIIVFHAIYVVLMPDWDWGWAITRNWFLAPGFWIMRRFVSHRWFTHDIRWILLFGVICIALSMVNLNLLTLAIFNFFAVSIIWVVIDNKRLKYLFVLWAVLSSPLLLNPIYWHSFLLGAFISYILHMFWDAPTDEGWDIINFLWVKLRVIFPFAFDAWGWFEKRIIYPVLILLLIFFVFGAKDFWYAKMIQEFYALIKAYTNLV